MLAVGLGTMVKPVVIPLKHLADNDHSEISCRLDPELLSLGLLDHASPNIRLSALNTVIASITNSGILQDSALARIKKVLPYFHQETNPKPRNEFIALAKKLLARLKGLKFVVTEDEPDMSMKDIETPIHNRSLPPKNAARFFDWYLDFLIQELRPTASYQGHITALSILNYVFQADFDDLRLKDKPQPAAEYQRFNCTALDSITRCLLDLLFDPFDDVRQLSDANLNILVKVELHGHSALSNRAPAVNDASINDYKVVRSTVDTISKADSLFRKSGRADHADGLGRLLNLAFSGREFSAALYGQFSLYKVVEYDLEQDIKAGSEDIELALNSAPLHGHLIALRLVTAKTTRSTRYHVIQVYYLQT